MMVNMLLSLSLATLLVVHISANTSVFQNPDDVSAVSASQNLFARDLYLNIANRQSGNIFFSPFSIATLFGIVHIGSKGNTETQIKNVFHYPDDKLSIRRGYKDLMTTFKTGNSNYTLTSTNKIYIHENSTLLDSFNDAITNDFLSSSENVNFVESETVRANINSYVENATNSKIKDLLPQGSINSLTRFVLVNAIYFNGLWKSPFNASYTRDLPFWVSNNESIDIPMMWQEDRFHLRFDRELQADILKLKYQGDDVSFVMVLPFQRDGLNEVEAKLHNISLESLDSNLYEGDVYVTMPKFKLEETLNLKEQLKELGLEDPFKSTADFSDMSSDKVFISDAFHKAFLEVDEKGTEAAAATGIVFHLASIPPSVVADHPFLFFIKHEVSNSILFAGRFVQPTN